MSGLFSHAEVAQPIRVCTGPAPVVFLAPTGASDGAGTEVDDGA